MLLYFNNSLLHHRIYLEYYTAFLNFLLNTTQKLHCLFICWVPSHKKVIWCREKIAWSPVYGYAYEFFSFSQHEFANSHIDWCSHVITLPLGIQLLHSSTILGRLSHHSFGWPRVLFLSLKNKSKPVKCWNRNAGCKRLHKIRVYQNFLQFVC